MTGRRVWIGLSLALLAVGCSTPPKQYFYTLSDYTVGDYTVGDRATGDAAATGSKYSVAIAPVSVPEGVDRPQMVVRAGTNRVELSELHRWAEPLKSEIPRVLAAHLRRALVTARIATADQSASLDSDYRIAVDVQRFESTLGERVTIEALWSVRAARGGRARAGRSFVSESARGADYEALAAAHGRALAQVAGELAGALRSLRSTGRYPEPRGHAVHCPYVLAMGLGGTYHAREYDPTGRAHRFTRVRRSQDLAVAGSGLLGHVPVELSRFCRVRPRQASDRGT